MKNYENNFFKIQILPRSLLLALLLAPTINNLEIFFTVSMSFYEFLWMFTSIYEYLRVFTSIYEYDTQRVKTFQKIISIGELKVCEANR